MEEPSRVNALLQKESYKDKGKAKVGDRGKIFLLFQMRGQEAEAGSLIWRVEGSGGKAFSEAMRSLKAAQSIHMETGLDSKRAIPFPKGEGDG